MSLPIGSIIMWYKPIVERPVGWQLCDGTNGTPDLRDKFVKGISADGEIGSVPYNSATHVHTNSSVVADGDHTHTVQVLVGGALTYWNVTTGGSSSASNTHRHDTNTTSQSSGTHQHTTSNTNNGDSNPPYITVFYIMRVS